MVEAFKRAPDSIGVMYIKKNCRYMYFNETYALFLQQLETRVSCLEYEMTAALEEEKSLLDVAISFIPPGARRDQQPVGRSHRAIGAIAAVAASAGLVLGEPIKNAACNALSIFNRCKNNDAHSRDVDNIMRTQNAIVKNLKRVQTGNDENFFLMGSENKGTQESVRKLKEVVDLRFKQMEVYLINATLFLARTSLACDHVIVRHMHLVQAIRNYVYQTGTLYTHLKAYHAAFFAYKNSLFSTFWSLAGGYIMPQFLLHQQIAKIVKELADDEIFRETKLSPAISNSFEAIYYEIQLFLEITWHIRYFGPTNEIEVFNI